MLTRLISKNMLIISLDTEKTKKQTLTSLQLRLNQLRQTISKLELKKLIKPFTNLVNKFIKKPVSKQFYFKPCFIVEFTNYGSIIGGHIETERCGSYYKKC